MGLDKVLRKQEVDRNEASSHQEGRRKGNIVQNKQKEKPTNTDIKKNTTVVKIIGHKGSINYLLGLMN